VMVSVVVVMLMRLGDLVESLADGGGIARVSHNDEHTP
jgi:hypothetical protein